MRQRYPNWSDKLTLLSNGFDPYDLLGVHPIRPPRAGFCLVHTGSFYGPRMPESLLEALRRLPADVQLELVGGKCNEVDKLIKRYGLTSRVQATSAQPQQDSIGLVLGCGYADSDSWSKLRDTWQALRVRCDWPSYPALGDTIALQRKC